MSEKVPKIGAKLSAARKARNLSQQAVADRLGKDRIAVSNWERDENFPEVPNLIALAALYEVSLDQLFDLPTAVDLVAQTKGGHLVAIEAKEPGKTYGVPRRDPNLIRGVIAGVLEPFGLSVSTFNLDTKYGLRIEAEWHAGAVNKDIKAPTKSRKKRTA